MDAYDLPKVILGKAFKAGTNITTGSPAVLLKNILEERGHRVVIYDPHVDETEPVFEPSVFLIGTKHPEFKNFLAPRGSVVIDPWRYLPDQPGVTIIRVGAPTRRYDSDAEANSLPPETEFSPSVLCEPDFVCVVNANGTESGSEIDGTRTGLSTAAEQA
jgi:hypothetical protein